MNSPVPHCIENGADAPPSSASSSRRRRVSQRDGPEGGGRQKRRRVDERRRVDLPVDVAVPEAGLDLSYDASVEFANLPQVEWIQRLLEEIEPEIHFDDDDMGDRYNPEGECFLCKIPSALDLPPGSGLWKTFQVKLKQFCKSPSNCKILEVHRAFVNIWEKNRERMGSEMPYMSKRLLVRHLLDHVSAKSLQLRAHLSTINCITLTLGNLIKHEMKELRVSMDTIKTYVQMLNLYLKVSSLDK